MTTAPEFAREPSGSPAATGSARRLDWRFLLPPTGDDRPLDVLRLLDDRPSAPGPSLAEQIVDLGVARTVLLGVGDRRQVDAVVDVTGDPRALLDAVSTLRPGGVLYAEVDRARPRGLGAGPARLRRRLNRRGLRTAVYARRRHDGYDTLWLPLDVAGAAPWYLHELVDDTDPRRRPVQRLLTVLVGRRGGRLGAVSRYLAVVGVRPASGGRAAGSVLTPALLAADTDGMVLPVVLARGQGAWSRVVLLPFGAADNAPRVVVKAARTAAHGWATEQEQRALSSVRDLLPERLAATVPVPLGTRTWSGLTVGTEAFLPGRPVAYAPADRSGGPDADDRLAGAVGWLIDLHTATRTETLAAPAASRLLDAPVRAAIEVLGLPVTLDGPSADGAWLPGRHEAWLLREASLPMVWEHGDLTPHNVRRDGHRHTVVDWEAARPGPALGDLLYLVLHWPWPGLPGFDTDPEEVLRRLFLTPAGPTADAAARQVRRYCDALGLDLGLVGPLLLHVLGRQALDRADRVRDGGGDPVADDNLYARLVLALLTATGPVPAWAGDR